MVGRTGPHPDDYLDLAFSLTIKRRASGAPISLIEIRALTGRKSTWTSTPNTRGAHFIGVARAKEPSFLLNYEGETLNLKADEEHDLILYVTDDGTFGDKNRKYQVRVVNADKTSFTVPVTDEVASQSSESVAVSGAVAVRMTAVLQGISNYDAVGPGRVIAGDEKGDGLFVLQVQAKDKVLTGIEISNTDGASSIWDTIPSSAHSAIGVALAEEPERLLNKRDSSISIPVKDRVDLNLYVADNGSIAGGQTHYRVRVTFQDGEMSWCQVENAPSPEATQAESRVNFLPTWHGYTQTDAVGPYPGLKPDGKRDAVLGLEIEISPKDSITGIEIENLDNPKQKWATGGISLDAWGIGIAYQSAPQALLNKPNGSIRIPIDRRVQFYLYIADPGDLIQAYKNLRVVVHLSNGTYWQQKVPSNTTLSVMPGVDEGIAEGILTCEFRGFIVDLVNQSTRPGKDGYMDGTFITKLEVENKKLAKVEISSDGLVRWSTDPRPPTMFLGAALYPKIYKLMNQKPGLMSIPLSGKRTLYLYAADNGMLSDTQAKLTVTVYFTDKTKLSTGVIK